MNGQKILVATLCVTGMLVGSTTAVGGMLYSLPNDLSTNPDELRVIDTSDGSTTSTVTMTSGGGAILGGGGLAVDPTSNVLYAVLEIGSSTAPQSLVTVNPFSGVTTTIGALSQRLSGIAFNAGGTLYGVLDDTGPPVQETMVTVSTADASSAFFMVLGNGGDGETIAYNPDDSLMYHASGQTIAGNILDSKIFESIDLTIPTVVTTLTIPDYVQGTNPEMMTALTYAGSSEFWMADRVSGNPPGSASGFFTIDTSGNTAYLGPMDHYSSGLAEVIPEPASVWLVLAGLAWAVFCRKRD